MSEIVYRQREKFRDALAKISADVPREHYVQFLEALIAESVNWQLELADLKQGDD